MATFTRKKAGDKTIYTNETTQRQVAADDLPKGLKEELDIADEGTEIDEETVTQGEGDGVTDADGKPIKTKAELQAEQAAADKAKEDAAREKAAKAAQKAKEQEEDKNSDDANPFRRAVPQEEKGFGFPRKNGKTGDIFDVSVPHTHLRVVAGLTVPLSEENYRTKSDTEIYDRLEELELV